MVDGVRVKQLADELVLTVQDEQDTEERCTVQGRDIGQGSPVQVGGRADDMDAEQNPADALFRDGTEQEKQAGGGDDEDRGADSQYRHVGRCRAGHPGGGEPAVEQDDLDVGTAGEVAQCGMSQFVEDAPGDDDEAVQQDDEEENVHEHAGRTCHTAVDGRRIS